jgi:hypothetical protein
MILIETPASARLVMNSARQAWDAVSIPARAYRART